MALCSSNHGHISSKWYSLHNIEYIVHSFKNGLLYDLTLEQTFVDGVSTRQLRALFTYWCHVCWLTFQQDNLVVDGRQMVSLVSVHGRVSLFDIYSLLHFEI